MDQPTVLYAAVQHVILFPPFQCEFVCPCRWPENAPTTAFHYGSFVGDAPRFPTDYANPNVNDEAYSRFGSAMRKAPSFAPSSCGYVVRIFDRARAIAKCVVAYLPDPHSTRVLWCAWKLASREVLHTYVYRHTRR